MNISDPKKLILNEICGHNEYESIMTNKIDSLFNALSNNKFLESSLISPEENIYVSSVHSDYNNSKTYEVFFSNQKGFILFSADIMCSDVFLLSSNKKIIYMIELLKIKYVNLIKKSMNKNTQLYVKPYLNRVSLSQIDHIRKFNNPLVQNINSVTKKLFEHSVYIYSKDHPSETGFPKIRNYSTLLKGFPIKYADINKKNMLTIEHSLFNENDSFQKACLNIPNLCKSNIIRIENIQDLNIYNNHMFFAQININSDEELKTIYKNKRIISNILKRKDIQHIFEFTYHGNEK